MSGRFIAAGLALPVKEHTSMIELQRTKTVRTVPT